MARPLINRVWCIRCKKNGTRTHVHPGRNLCLEHCIAHDGDPNAPARSRAAERRERDAQADVVDGFNRDDLGESPDY